MKKMLLDLLALGVIVSCGKKEEPAVAEPAATEATETTTETAEPAATEAATTEAPKFKDADVQKYVDDYSTFIKDMQAATEAKDAAKIQELSAKAQEWATKGAEVGQKLAADPEEAKKYADYMTKLGEEFTNAMKAQ